MSNWDKFKKVEQPTSGETPPSEILRGTFGCQTCYEYVEEATYFYTDGVLKWVCSEGHVSFAENFYLA